MRETSIGGRVSETGLTIAENAPRYGMSRYDSRDDDRSADQDRAVDYRDPDRIVRKDRMSGHLAAPARNLDLPRGEERESVSFRDREYHLNGEQSRALSTIGAFRVVPADDLGDNRSGDTWRSSLKSLADQGLIERHNVVLDQKKSSVVVLTKEGKQLLEEHRRDHAGSRQEYYAGLVKPRELAHDAQLFRVYRDEGARIDERGGRVDRVVLDFEFKRDYQKFLNRKDRPDPPDLGADMRAFADEHHLPIVDGHLELPDLRIEYQDDDGRFTHRDFELVTEHYSRSQIAGKEKAGFFCHRGAGGRVRGGNARRGGTPYDPKWMRG